jgi:hypothetical protein
MADRQAVMLRAMTDLVTERVRNELPASPVTVEAPQVTVEAPPPADVHVALDLAPVAAALRMLAEAQAETNRLLAELAKALAAQKAPQVTVNVPPRKPLRLVRDDGSEAIIQEMG